MIYNNLQNMLTLEKKIKFVLVDMNKYKADKQKYRELCYTYLTLCHQINDYSELVKTCTKSMIERCSSILEQLEDVN